MAPLVLPDLLGPAANTDETAVALVAPARQALTYAALRTQTAATIAALRHAGVGRQDTVALVLPNGPELAAAALAIASGARCAPLNPAFRAQEFRFVLSDLEPAVLVVAANDRGEVRAAATALGVRCIDVQWTGDAPAGTFALGGAAASASPAAADDPARPDDIALLLHTSGTTARPKLVPLTHRNLCASAINVARSLALAPGDRCLNMMPLFHIHGLVASLLASLAAGASVACCPGYRDGRFLPWLDTLQPTWYTAAPAVHQAVLAEVARHPEGAAAGRLRFARSASAPLPSTVLRDLESALRAPVLEAYGMTEAAHQIASNPLPPAARRPKSVGLPAGPSVAIMDADQRLLPPGSTGEIVIRGDNVTAGYASPREANVDAFVAGWFRTGDLGRIDDAGYVHLAGRLKDVINRAGEKVSPAEVDEALREHRDVTDAATFAVPHPTMGEDIAAAVVLKDMAKVSASDIRAFLFGRLAEFKIPSQVVVVDAIPVGATGKIARGDLHAHFASYLRPAFVAPRDESEREMAALFGDVLGTSDVGAFDNFFALGGDSLRGFQLLARIRTQWQVDVPIVELFREPNVAQLAGRVARLGPDQGALLLQRLGPDPVNGHRLVARTFASLGLTHVYGVPGEPVYDTFGACVDAGLRTIGTRHQLAGAMMAAAHNYFAGQQKAATIVSAGAPAANALGAMVQARDNCWPLLVLAGVTRDPGAASGHFMALDIAELCRPIAKAVVNVGTTQDIPGAIVAAFEAALSGRPGPAIVQVPEHVLAGFARDDGTGSSPDLRRRATEPARAAVERATVLLLGAKRPLLILGSGTRWNSPFAALRSLVDSLGLPFITSPIGRGAIPDDHPLCMNAIRWVAQSQADVALVLGARLNRTFRHGRQLPEDAAIVQVGVHAPAFDRDRKPALSIASDVGTFLKALLREPGIVRNREAGGHRDSQWPGSLRTARDATTARREARANADSILLSPLRLAREIRDFLPRDAITIFDGNLVMEAMEQLIPAFEPASRLTPGSSGCLGAGIPFAIAAKLLHPQRPVVAICGDFAFGLSAMELETAVRHKVPIVVVVANNDGNSGSLRQNAHMPAGAEPITRFEAGVRYEGIVKIFGGHAEDVRRPEDVRAALERAFASGCPACVNVAVDPDATFPSD